MTYNTRRCTATSFIQAVLLVSVLTAPTVYASSGDESWAFKNCVRTCTTTSCVPQSSITELLSSANEKESSASLEISERTALAAEYCTALCPIHNGTHPLRALIPPPALFLRIMRWDCASDCGYLCMWSIENSKISSKKTPTTEKYFGKWPFVRLLGAQEPASVVFSILNLLANVWCLGAVVRSVRRSSSDPKPQPLLLWLWTVHFLLSTNAWLWSSVFHCRDVRITERLDYFSAGALVAFNLFLTLVRTLNINSGPTLSLLGAPLAIAYVRHVQSMHFVLFDYGYHVMLCVGAGAVQTIAWAVWALFTHRGRTHPGRRALLSFMAAVNVSMLLEVLDFPPLWGVFDAHALWHAATAPLTLPWFRFVSADLALGTLAGSLKLDKAT